MSQNKVYKPKPISGFPEYLPEVRLVEQQWLDHIRSTFESYGFCSIETPSIEELDVITAKGEVDKEIYVLKRLHEEESGQEAGKAEGLTGTNKKDARLALHFDQTVPLARYVAQHFNELVFPFKRYQIQRVWRGERPQAGRFREFTQCDIDVINVDALPLHFDAGMPAIIWEVLSSLPGMEGGKNIQLRISNRKILMGLCDVIGVDDSAKVIRIIDKKDKIGEDDAIADLLDMGVNDEQAAAIIELYSIRTSASEISGLLRDFIARNDVIARSDSDAAIQTLNEGVEELTFVMDRLGHLPEGAVVADLSIVRGLDYYTGTVYETVFTDDPGYGSICSGGRYDDLASSYINKSLPGVGISIGFSRLFARLLEQGKLDTTRKSPVDVLMLLPHESQHEIAVKTAQTLRQKGHKVEMYHKAQKLQKQLSYAEKKGIPYVWFPGDGEVKNMSTSEQSKADPENWNPDET